MQQTKENIFQIWDRLGRKMPFIVKPDHWPVDEFVVIERIECDNLPYGKAFGYPVKKGKPSNHFQDDISWRQEKIIPLAGDFSWVVVIANYSDLFLNKSVSKTSQQND